MVVEVTLTTVFIAALITALTTGIGAVPLVFSKNIGKKWLSVGAAMAAGLMLAASHSLTEEGMAKQEWLTLAGMVTGLILVYLAYQWIEKQGAPDANKKLQPATVGAIVVLAFLSMMVFQISIH